MDAILNEQEKALLEMLNKSGTMRTENLRLRAEADEVKKEIVSKNERIEELESELAFIKQRIANAALALKECIGSNETEPDAATFTPRALDEFI